MDFAHPIWLALLLPLAVAVWRMVARHTRPALRFGFTHPLHQVRPSMRIRLLHILPWISALALVLLVIAMARPRKALATFQREANAISIQMVLDVSGSMEALDMATETAEATTDQQTRLDVVKEMFSRLIALRPDDQIGLIAFGGFASSLAPLTLDHETLREILAGLTVPKPIQDPSSGDILNAEERLTAIGDALALACQRLRDAQTQSRIIVLLSDGDSNAGILTVDEAASIAAELGFRVYTIGVGETGYAPVRVTDPMGRVSIQTAWITFDETALQETARKTGGQYFHVTDKEGLEAAIESINAMETTAIEQDTLTHHAEHYRWFILPAFVLLLLTTTLSACWTLRVT